MNLGQENLLEAIDANNEVGFLDLAVKRTGAANENLLAVRLGDGATVFAAPTSFSELENGKFRFNGSFDALRRADSDRLPLGANQQNINQPNFATTDVRTNERGGIVVPLIAEEIKVGRRTVETGGVRVHKTVREDVKTIDEPIVREHLDIKRVEINQYVETAPAVRYEGDVMIVPVLEEVVITQKRLLLREELRIVKRREEISNPQQFTLRREEINLEQIEVENTEPGAASR